jgi:hypothetical protein
VEVLEALISISGYVTITIPALQSMLVNKFRLAAMLFSHAALLTPGVISAAAVSRKPLIYQSV